MNNLEQQVAAMGQMLVEALNREVGLRAQLALVQKKLSEQHQQLSPLATEPPANGN